MKGSSLFCFALILWLLFLNNFCKAQSSDCPSAQVLPNFNSLVVAGGAWGDGTIEEFPTCFFNTSETNSRWFQFTVGIGGVLNFSITPTDGTTDFDWGFYDITNSATGTCNLSAANQLSCNYSGAVNAPPTGMGCNTSNAQCAAAVNLQPCHTYAIIVNRFSATNSGFTLAFAGTTAVIGSPNLVITADTTCIGLATSFTNNVPAGAYNYAWDFGNGTSSNLAAPSVTYAAVGNYIVSLLMTSTNPNSCFDSLSANTNAIVIPGPTISVNPNTSNICPGQSVDLTASSNALGFSGPVSFTNNTVTNIPDNTPAGTNSTITTSGLIGATLTSVCININHQTDADIDVYLICPDGTQINLTSDNGLAGDNYINSCFTTTAATSITTAIAPMTGNYLPEQSLNLLAGCNMNGVWTLNVVDDNVGPFGTLLNWTITFQQNNPNPNYSWSPSATLNPSDSLATTASPSVTTTYTVTVTDGVGCTNTATSVVNITPAFTLTTNPASAIICNGASTNLSASGAVNYSWSPSASLNSSTGNTVSASPVTTTTYTITGSDNTGCVDTATVIVNLSPNPIITSNPASTLICSGNNTTLTATGGVSYSWSPSISLNTSTSSSVTASPGSTTTYTVTGANANGCTSNATSTVTVVNNPAIIISPTSLSICNGASDTITASGTNTFSWSPNTGISSNTEDTIVVNPTTTTTYTVTGTISSGCTAQQTIIVTVNNNPTININAIDPSICNGFSTGITAAGASQYTWSPSSGLNNITSSNVTASPTISTTYSVLGTDINGCTGTSDIAITVNTPFQVGISASDSIVCPGTTILLNGNSVQSYSWSPTGGTGANTNTYSVSPTQSTTYTVIGTDINSCTSNITLAISVLDTPIINLQNTSGLICYGDSAKLTASGATSYTWLPSSSLTSSTGNLVYAFPTINTNYQVIAIDNNGCEGSKNIAVLIDSLPIASFSFTPLEGCEPLLVNFNNTSDNAVTYKWYFGDSTISNSLSPSHSYALGSYLASLIAYNTVGCSDTIIALDSIHVYPLPIADFTVNPDFGVEVKFDSALFVFTNLSIGATTYDWSFGDGLSSTDFNPTHRYNVTGQFPVELIATSDKGCTDIIIKEPLVVNEIPPLFIPNTFSPNGDGKNDTYLVYGIGVKDIEMKIFDRWGQMVFETKNINQSWDGTFNNTIVNTGVYVYWIRANLLNGNQVFYKGDITLIK